MIGRRGSAAPPPPDEDATSTRLTRLTAAVDQAVSAIDASLRAARGNSQLVNALLDVRLALRPPARQP